MINFWQKNLVQPIPIPSPLFRIVDRLRLSRDECKAFFSWFLETRVSRIEALVNSIKGSSGNGSWMPTYRAEDLTVVDSFFIKRVQSRIFTQREIVPIESMFSKELQGLEIPNQTLTDESILLSVDVATYFGTVMKNEMPEVDWCQVLDDSFFVDYGYPLICKKSEGGGFCNPSRLMFVYGLNLVRETARNDLGKLFAAWSRLLS